MTLVSNEVVHMLVVEDDADTVHGLSVALQPYGFELTFAADVQSAVAAIAANRPDVVLLDLGLPGGENGKHLLESLRQSQDCRPLPVIVLSGTDSAFSIDQALAAGASRYLVKPVTSDKLLLTIDQVLSRIC